MKKLFLFLILILLAQFVHAQCSTFAITASVTSPSCAFPCNGSANVTVSGGTAPYSYQWDNGNTTPVFGSLCPGTYVITVTDNNGCNATDAVTITGVNNPLQLIVNVNNNSSCFNINDGSASAIVNGGVPPYNFIWSNGSANATVTGLSAGTHSVTVTDQSNCTVQDFVFVLSPPALGSTTTANNSSCSSPCSGSASIIANGGTVPYTYLWATGATTPTVTGLCPGNYTVSVMDANGCMDVNSVTIIGTSNALHSTITLINDVSCTSLNDGSASVAVTGGVPPYSVLWSNGETTFIATQLEPGLQTVVVNDSLGCSTSGTILIGDSGISFSVTSSNTTCSTDDGTATVTLNPPIPNPTFQWSNGATSQVVTGLAEGWYSVTVVNQDNGCRSKRLIEVIEDPSCFVTIEGYVFIDNLMPDCVTDPGTLPAISRLVCLSNGVDSTYTLTDSTGYYSFTGDAGTYTVRLVLPQFHNLICGSTINTVNAPILQSTYQGGDFYLDVTPIQDMSVYISSGPARPGFSRSMRVHYCNFGSDTISGTIELVHDSILTNFYALGQEDSYDPTTNTVIWSYFDLPPGDCRLFYVRFTIPATSPIGTQLCDDAFITPLAGDINEANNSFTLCQTITGSWDPNDKQNFIGEDPFGGDFYEEDSTFLYQVRFQNTGNDTAFTVVIRDTLDSNLDVESLNLIEASHNYTLQFDGPNILEFWFQNIMLPDSNVNEPASNGHVLFTINRAMNIPIGTTIENRAGIYFDFNAPVMTNTVVNTLAILASIGEEVPEEQLLPLVAFPNPTSDALYLEVTLPEAGNTSVSVYDVTGQLVGDELSSGHLQKGRQQLQIATKDLPDGTYFLRLQSGNFVGVTRVIVVH